MEWRYLVLCCAIIWFVAHTHVIGPGALETWDESRFPHCIDATRAFSSGDFTRGAHYIVAGTQSRPFACVTWLPHIALYEGSQALGASETHSLRIALSGNFLWTATLTLAIFDLGILAFGLSPALAGLASVIFLGFFSTSLNIKHFYPYDAALEISLASLVYALRPFRAPARRAVALGLGASLAFVTYPGYYFVYLILGATAAHPRVRGATPLNISLLWFCGAAFLPICACEVLAQHGGVGFAASLRHLSGTVSLGSYREMFTFPVSYAIHGEGALGCVSLAVLAITGLALGYRWIIPSRRLSGSVITYRPLPHMVPLSIGDLLILLVAAAFLFHTVSGYYLHLFVWYRRLLHLFLPWIALLVARSISSLPHAKRVVTVVMLVTIITCSVASHISALRHIAYPRDLLLSIGVKGRSVNPALEATDLGCWPTTVLWRYERWNIATDKSLHAGLVLRNFCSGFMPDGGERPLKPDQLSHSTPLFSAPHYENLPAYQYDGIPPELRVRIRRLTPRVEIGVLGRRLPQMTKKI